MSEPRKTKVAEGKKIFGKSAGMKAAADAAVAKKASPKTAEPRTTGPQKKPAVSAEERFCMIQTAAYYVAERDGFGSDPTGYWIEGERKIAELLDR